MLSFANEARQLQQIKGGLDVIKEMGLAVQDGARLIDDYMKSPFFCMCTYTIIRDPLILNNVPV
jgi:hypothetical protein